MGGAIRTRRKYAKAITAAFTRAVESIFETGRLLVEAKADIPHGDFIEMVESDLPFSISTAERLMKIAADARLGKFPLTQLPSKWSVLYELSRLDDSEFERVEPQVNPEITRPAIRRLLRNGKAPKKEMEATTLTFDFPDAPTYNQAIDYAKKRDRRNRPIIYDVKKKEYERQCDWLVLGKQLPKPPEEPWQKWRYDRVVIRKAEKVDWTEMYSVLKWPVDWLVKEGYVADDSQNELMTPLPHPEFVLDRENPGVLVTIRRLA